MHVHAAKTCMVAHHVRKMNEQAKIEEIFRYFICQLVPYKTQTLTGINCRCKQL